MNIRLIFWVILILSLFSNVLLSYRVDELRTFHRVVATNTPLGDLAKPVDKIDAKFTNSPDDKFQIMLMRADTVVTRVWHVKRAEITESSNGDISFYYYNGTNEKPIHLSGVSYAVTDDSDNFKGN